MKTVTLENGRTPRMRDDMCIWQERNLAGHLTGRLVCEEIVDGRVELKTPEELGFAMGSRGLCILRDPLQESHGH